MADILIQDIEKSNNEENNFWIGARQDKARRFTEGKRRGGFSF